MEGLIRWAAFKEALQASHYAETLGDAVVLIAIVADFWKACGVYKDRGYRNVLIEAGCVVQMIQVAASVANLGSCLITGYDEDRLNDAMRMDGMNEGVVGIVALGRCYRA